jgi:hypothetical protein
LPPPVALPSYSSGQGSGGNAKIARPRKSADKGTTSRALADSSNIEPAASSTSAPASKVSAQVSVIETDETERAEAGDRGMSGLFEARLDASPASSQEVGQKRKSGSTGGGSGGDGAEQSEDAASAEAVEEPAAPEPKRKKAAAVEKVEVPTKKELNRRRKVRVWWAIGDGGFKRLCVPAPLCPDFSVFGGGRGGGGISPTHSIELHTKHTRHTRHHYLRVPSHGTHTFIPATS